MKSAESVLERADVNVCQKHQIEQDSRNDAQYAVHARSIYLLIV
jgi:hypothetical protein